MLLEKILSVHAVHFAVWQSTHVRDASRLSDVVWKKLLVHLWAQKFSSPLLIHSPFNLGAQFVSPVHPDIAHIEICTPMKCSRFMICYQIKSEEVVDFSCLFYAQMKWNVVTYEFSKVCILSQNYIWGRKNEYTAEYFAWSTVVLMQKHPLPPCIHYPMLGIELDALPQKEPIIFKDIWETQFEIN